MIKSKGLFSAARGVQCDIAHAAGCSVRILAFVMKIFQKSLRKFGKPIEM